jgi:hypothetical protein
MVLLYYIGFLIGIMVLCGFILIVVPLFRKMAEKIGKNYLVSIDGFGYHKNLKFTRVYLYPNRITLNDILIIPLDRVQEARAYSISKRKYREIYYYNFVIEIDYIDLEKNNCTIKATSAQMSSEQHGWYYQKMSQKINEIVAKPIRQIEPREV